MSVVRDIIEIASSQSHINFKNVIISIGSYQSTREVLWNPRPSPEGARARMNKVLPSTSVMEPIYPEQCALLAS